jgi:hypothetical protein
MGSSPHGEKRTVPRGSLTVRANPRQSVPICAQILWAYVWAGLDFDQAGIAKALGSSPSKAANFGLVPLRARKCQDVTFPLMCKRLDGRARVRAVSHQVRVESNEISHGVNTP